MAKEEKAGECFPLFPEANAVQNQPPAPIGFFLKFPDWLVQVTFKGKGMVFSADHMNDPARIRSMCEEGFMSKGRRDALLDFPWHRDIIFHEAGIPPIHTPMQTLQVRERAFWSTLRQGQSKGLVFSIPFRTPLDQRKHIRREGSTGPFSRFQAF